MIKNVQHYPELAEINLGRLNLVYGKHALTRITQRGIQKLPFIQVTAGTVVELEESSSGKVEKLVVRLPYLETDDMVLVIIPHRLNNREVLVKTVWLNNVNDHHATLKLAG